MWPILLKILSIIGIVLASIIGVILLLLIILLLCPITYKLAGNAHSDEYKVNVKIKYLFGLVRAIYAYPEPNKIVAKALWFTIFDSSKSGDEIEETKAKAKTSGKNVNVENNEANSDDSSISVPTTNNSTEKINNKESKTIKENQGNSGKKIRNPIYLIKKKWYELNHKLVDKIKLIFKDVTFYKKLIENDDTEILISKVKKAILKVLKIIAPKKGVGDITFGMDSPDTTAYIYGAYCVILNKLRNKIVVTPDFENKQIEGHLKISGYFNLISLVVVILPLVFSKHVKLLRARLDRHSINMEKAKRKFEKVYNDNLTEVEKDYAT